MATETRIPRKLLQEIEETFINLVNEGRPLSGKLEKLRQYLYFNPKTDAIIITRSESEVKHLKELLGKEYEPFPVDKFSVRLTGYSTEWHWKLKNGDLSGSSGSGSLQNSIDQNPTLPIFEFSQFLYTKPEPID